MKIRSLTIRVPAPRKPLEQESPEAALRRRLIARSSLNELRRRLAARVSS